MSQYFSRFIPTALISILALLSVYFFPWPAAVVIGIVASFFFPPIAILVGGLLDISYYASVSVPYFIIGGLMVSILATFVQQFFKTRIMS